MFVEGSLVWLGRRLHRLRLRGGMWRGDGAPRLRGDEGQSRPGALHGTYSAGTSAGLSWESERGSESGVGVGVGERVGVRE